MSPAVNASHGGDQVVTARRTETMDAANIAKLVDAAAEQVFGRLNVVNIIERANLSVSLVNQNDELIGSACFFDYPNVPGVDPGHWEEWLGSFYKTSQCNSVNTLFLHLFVSRPEYSHGSAKEIVSTLFNAVPEVHFVFLMVPKTSYPEAALTTIFTQMERLENTKGLEKHALFCCTREQFVPMLHVRQARVQDHDDLTPIFNRQSDMLNNTYGKFFLAELIEAQDESMHCLVAEIDGTAVGFMSLCTEVNLDLLNKCFDLGPLHGLRKPSPADITVDTLSSKTMIGETNGMPASQPRASEAKDASSLGGQSRVESDVQRKLSEEMLDYLSDVSGSLSTSRSSSVADKLEQTEDLASQKSERKGQPKASPQLPRLPSKFIPVYHGPSNAFSIQLFCVDEKYEMRSLDLLREAFIRMPDKEFAVITVPHLVPEFPLLQKFLRVTPRVTSTLPQELYVFHKMGLLENFVVRDALVADFGEVEQLVQTLSLKENLLKDLQQYNAAKRDADGTEIRAYVAEVAKQIVGIAVVRREEDIEYIRSHYNIEDFIYFNHHGRTEHGHLHHFALNPIFSHFSKHFIKDVLRKSQKTSLYYPVFPPYLGGQKVNLHSRVTCLNELIPVRARRQIIYPLSILEDRAPSRRVLKKQDPYGLCHINRKLTLEPKIVINARIIVVGASTAAVAFLEALVFCPHLRFNNLVLISPHGLSGELTPDSLRDAMLGSDHCYSEQEHACLSLRSWVNVVYGKMTRIDRNKKHVHVNNERIVPFDHLIIATGEQHQYPMPTSHSVEPQTKHPQNNPHRWFVGTPPSNLFVVNDDYDAAVSLHWMEQHITQAGPTGKVVVYGNVLRAYCTVQALVDLGVNPEHVVLVKTREEGPSCFNNPFVETHVLAAMVDQYKMVVLEDGLLKDWIISPDNTIAELIILTPDNQHTFPCLALFSYTKPRVDLDAFKAINEACLVFDGKLVIDTTFHTNDISIRGVGPVTKYQRRYHSMGWTHKNFNSKEIGKELAAALLSLFDPTIEQQKVEEEPLKLIPTYHSPKVQGGLLPGGLHYLHVAKPSLHIPLQTAMANPEYGSALITGDDRVKGEQGINYFRLHFNAYKTVETITCLSTEPIDVSNIVCLYGIHQRLLNNVMQRFSEEMIKNLYSFFSEAWCLAIYHDRFSDFRDEIRELLVNQPAPDVPALEEKVRKLIDDDLELDLSQRKSLHDIYSDTGVKRNVETRLLGFLSYNYYHLPMFAKPGMV